MSAGPSHKEVMIHPLPRPMEWARYADRSRALDAMDRETFGQANWSVEHRPDSEWPEYPWVLLDYGWESEDA